MIAAGIYGTAYAGLLWLVARHIAYVRGIALGGWPYLTIVGCGTTAGAITAYFPADRTPLLSATLIGAIVCAKVDARTGYIFDGLTVGVGAIACTIALWTGHLVDGAIAVGVVGGAFLALYLLTRRRGIGLGDVKLATVLALGYGLQLSVVAAGSAFIIGAGYAGILLGTRRAQRTDALRFGPFIAGGAGAGLIANVLGYRW